LESQRELESVSVSDSNPFANQKGARAGRGQAGAWGWIVAGLIAVAAGVLGWQWYSDRINQRQMIEGLRTSLAEKGTGLANAEAEIQKRQERIAALQSRAAALKSQVADLENEKKQTAQKSNNLEKEMRSDLESKDVTISNLKGKLMVNILDRVMFDSGEAVLKPDGEAVLQKVADILGKHPEIKIHVIGHTDNVPIRAGGRGRFASNWELSTARALAAVHFLSEQAGIDARRMGAVGYGEFRPIADNATAEGRAKNRRIAIAIMSDEIAGADSAPATAVPSSTNAAPVAEESVPVSPAQ
jgi:chemotaxis protein MotB